MSYALASQTIEKLRTAYPNACKRWTEEDDAKLEEMYNEGESLKVLSKQFGRTQKAIEARLVKLGLMDDEYFEAQTAELAKLLEKVEKRP